jgi:hypothetical protein
MLDYLPINLYASYSSLILRLLRHNINTKIITINIIVVNNTIKQSIHLIARPNSEL